MIKLPSHCSLSSFVQEGSSDLTDDTTFLPPFSKPPPHAEVPLFFKRPPRCLGRGGRASTRRVLIIYSPSSSFSLSFYYESHRVGHQKLGVCLSPRIQVSNNFDIYKISAGRAAAAGSVPEPSVTISPSCVTSCIAPQVPSSFSLLGFSIFFCHGAVCVCEHNWIFAIVVKSQRILDYIRQRKKITSFSS